MAAARPSFCWIALRICCFFTLVLLVPPRAWTIEITPLADDPTGYTVSWDAPTGCTESVPHSVTCHTLEERTDSATWSVVPVPAGSTSWRITGRAPGRYDYRIRHDYVRVDATRTRVTQGPSSISVGRTDGVLFRQNFEELSIGSNWYGDENLQVVSYGAAGLQGKVLQATYVPTPEGSARLTRRFPLDNTEGVSSATLSFDMKLDSDFEFVNGGKLHGLGGGSATTGCGPIDPLGWSVRLMWRGDGIPNLYIYHQDRANRCGDDFFLGRDFRFERSRWYRVEIHVQMNSSPGAADGRATLYVDGEQLIDVNHLNLSGDRSVGIDRLLFNTFHGGSDSSWSPSTNTYAHFDNFTVYPGKQVAGLAGTACEVFSNGIYSPSTTACCPQACGSCGGRGCASLAGGSTQCCTRPILASGNWCPVGDTSSTPCAFYDPFIDGDQLNSLLTGAPATPAARSKPARAVGGGSAVISRGLQDGRQWE